MNEDVLMLLLRSYEGVGMPDRHMDLVAEMRAASQVGSAEERGLLHWRQLLERAADEIEQLRAELVTTRVTGTT